MTSGHLPHDFVHVFLPSYKVARPHHSLVPLHSPVPLLAPELHVTLEPLEALQKDDNEHKTKYTSCKANRYPSLDCGHLHDSLHHDVLIRRGHLLPKGDPEPRARGERVKRSLQLELRTNINIRHKCSSSTPTAATYPDSHADRGYEEAAVQQRLPLPCHQQHHLHQANLQALGSQSESHNIYNK